MGNVSDSSFNHCAIEQLGFSKERYNSDQSRVNNYGRRLLDLCKSCDLYIANARLGLDKFLGSKTCKGTSVVDYVILSPCLFPYISEFEVLPFDPMISDAHCGIHFSLICNEIELKQNLNVESITVNRASWNNVESASFIEHLDTNRITSFIDNIDALDNAQVSARIVQDLTLECSSILTDAADEVGFIKKIVSKPVKKSNLKKKKH